MKIYILTLFPEIIDAWFNHSILKRSIEKKIVEIEIHNIRDYSNLKNKQVDDYPYGGGAGMLLMAEPLALCLDSILEKKEIKDIIFPTPDGKQFNQKIANSLSLKKELIFICGHYKGIDQRFRDHFNTDEYSIGDYVVTGGEMSSMVMIDAIIRLIPGVISDIDAALSDSFQDGLLDAPQYTRPKKWRGHSVPEILLSGNHKNISEWQHEKALEKTKKRRKDLLDE